MNIRNKRNNRGLSLYTFCPFLWVCVLPREYAAVLGRRSSPMRLIARAKCLPVGAKKQGYISNCMLCGVAGE